MNLPIRMPRRAMSLVELMISISLMAFIFGSMAFMIFYSGRNSLVVREQARSQTSAGRASERITNMLRNAKGFRPNTGDMSTTKSEVLFDIPQPDGSIRTGIVTFNAASSVNDSDGVVKIFDDISGGYDADDRGDWNYPYIQDFKIVFNTPTWITVVVSYTYRGFSLSTLDADGDGVQDRLLAGEFVTDVIAKNHHPGESAKYGETTTTLFQL